MTRSQPLASAVDVDREVEVPPGPSSSAWLAAYALGLAHTSRSPYRCRQQLVEAADGCDRRLRQARNLVAALTALEGDVRDRATQLLDAASKGCDSHRAGPSPRAPALHLTGRLTPTHDHGPRAAPPQ